MPSGSSWAVLAGLSCLVATPHQFLRSVGHQELQALMAYAFAPAASLWKHHTDLYCTGLLVVIPELHRGIQRTME